MTGSEPADPTPGNRVSRLIRRGCAIRLAVFLVFFGAFGLGAGVLVFSPDPAGEPEDRQQTRLRLLESASNLADSEAAALPALNESADEGPVYSVQPLANVDILTAEMTLESIQTSGFSGFLIAGSGEEGYDVWRPGLEFDEALRLELELISSSIIPRNDSLPTGFFVVESDNLR